MNHSISPIPDESNHPADEPLSPEALAAQKAARAERLAARIAQAELTQTGDDNLHILHDPIEDDPQMAPLIKAAEKKAKIELRGTKVGMGWCHMFWGVKEQILQEEYGVEWFSPAEMNPNVCFD